MKIGDSVSLPAALVSAQAAVAGPPPAPSGLAASDSGQPGCPRSAPHRRPTSLRRRRRAGARASRASRWRGAASRWALPALFCVVSLPRRSSAIERDAGSMPPYDESNGNWKTFDGAGIALPRDGYAAVVAGATLYIVNRPTQAEGRVAFSFVPLDGGRSPADQRSLLKGGGTRARARNLYFTVRAVVAPGGGRPGLSGTEAHRGLPVFDGREVPVALQVPGGPLLPGGPPTTDGATGDYSRTDSATDAGTDSPIDSRTDSATDAGSDSGVVVPPGSVANGQPCSANGSCTSGTCKDGVCCENACTGACQACAETYTGMSNGKCGAVKGGHGPAPQPREPGTPESCGNDGTCDGEGACRKYGSEPGVRRGGLQRRDVLAGAHLQRKWSLRDRHRGELRHVPLHDLGLRQAVRRGRGVSGQEVIAPPRSAAPRRPTATPAARRASAAPVAVSTASAAPPTARAAAWPARRR